MNQLNTQASNEAVQMPPLPVVAYRARHSEQEQWHLHASPVSWWEWQPLCKVSDTQAYAAQRCQELANRVKVLEGALTSISKLHPKYEGDWTPDATISDFGGNADDYARERALMLHASTGSKARAALNQTKD